MESLDVKTINNLQSALYKWFYQIIALWLKKNEAVILF